MNPHNPLHRQTWDLIPWLVNETLDASQRATVEAHLDECSDCREELAFQRKVHAGIVEDAATSEAATSASLARLLERIDTEDAAFPSPNGFDPLAVAISGAPIAPKPGGRRLRLAHWLAAAAILEAIGLVGLGAKLAGQRDAADASAPYVSLSQGERSVQGASIRLVPSPTLSVGDLQTLLGEAGLHIVDSDAGGRILALGFESSSAKLANGESGAPPGRIARALLQLRANRGVLLAEPILSSTTLSR